MGFKDTLDCKLVSLNKAKFSSVLLLNSFNKRINWGFLSLHNFKSMFHFDTPLSCRSSASESSLQRPTGDVPRWLNVHVQNSSLGWFLKQRDILFFVRNCTRKSQEIKHFIMISYFKSYPLSLSCWQSFRWLKLSCKLEAINRLQKRQR